jgi:hypothetical protein
MRADRLTLFLPNLPNSQGHRLVALHHVIATNKIDQSKHKIGQKRRHEKAFGWKFLHEFSEIEKAQLVLVEISWFNSPLIFEIHAGRKTKFRLESTTKLASVFFSDTAVHASGRGRQVGYFFVCLLKFDQ